MTPDLATDAVVTLPDAPAAPLRMDLDDAPVAYQRFAATAVIIGEQLCEAVDLRAGWRVLDVATGTGNSALSAARRCCTVVGVDTDPGGFAQGRRRAAAEGVAVTFAGGDATRLPFADASFDAVVSTLGVMFAGDQQAAADELVRVCRPGGRIGLASWTPDGWAASFFALLGRLTRPEVTDRVCPFRWGSEQGLRALLGDRVADLTVTPRTFHARHHTPAAYWRFIQDTSGFVQQRLAGVDPALRAQVDADVLVLLARFNRSGDHTVVAAHDYLEAVAVKR